MSTLKRILGLVVILASVMALCGAAADLRTIHVAAQEGLPTETPTDTALPMETETDTPVPADTLTNTPLPTETPTETATLTPLPTDTPTDTPVPVDTLTNTPLPTDTPTETPTETPLPTDTLVPTMPGPPMLSVSTATNCRTGPSANYSVVYILRPGITVLVVGKDLPDNYWIIAVPGWSGTVCWLWGQYAMVTGDIDSLPSPATPLPSYYTLSEPKNLSASCSSEPFPDDEDASAWTVVLHWTNTEPNQSGVRIYRYGRQIAKLRGFARTYADYFIHYDFHPGVRYGIQAYNATAVSSIVWIRMNSCRP